MTVLEALVTSITISKELMGLHMWRTWGSPATLHTLVGEVEEGLLSHCWTDWLGFFLELDLDGSRMSVVV